MKITFSTNNYTFKDSKNSIQSDVFFNLEDNETIIKLGCLSFQNNQYNLSYDIDKRIFANYEDASFGIVKYLYDEALFIYNYFDESKEDFDKFLNKMTKDDLQNILDEINERTKKLSSFINNDLDKLKVFLKIVGIAMIENLPNFCKIDLSACELV